jgi:hypothetical protein
MARKIKIIERRENGVAEIIKVKLNGRWFKYILYSSTTRKKIDEFLTKQIKNNG